MNKWRLWLAQPVDAATLAVFRIGFGALMAWEGLLKYVPNSMQRYSPDDFHFTYPFFHWVEPLPGLWMYGITAVMTLAAAFIMLGLFYRASCVAYCLLYTYLFLIEKTLYNNHYYLISLLAFLLIFVDAHAVWSFDARRKAGVGKGWAPFWNVALLRFQVFVVYFYGGLAKIGPDWLRGEPMRNWLERRADYPVMGWFYGSELAPWFYSYGGIAFDLLIAPMLLWRRTRLLAVALLVLFHFSNAFMFKIGIFPYLALASTVIFFDPHTPRRVLQWFGRAGKEPAIPEQAPARKRRWQPVLGAVLIAYVIAQLLLPFRHFLYEGPVNWTEQGHHFAWHMKLRDKDHYVRYRLVNPETGSMAYVGPDDQRTYLSKRQRIIMAYDPPMTWQFGRWLHSELARHGVPEAEVYVEAAVSLNGRPYRFMLDPYVNLAEAERPLFQTAPWVAPLEPGLPMGDYDAWRKEEPEDIEPRLADLYAHYDALTDGAD